MPFYPHGIKRLGSPGYKTELAFFNWLEADYKKPCGDYWYNGFQWLSYNKKAPFDFKLELCTGVFYIDIVSFYFVNSGVRLITAHKSWDDLIKWAKNDCDGSDYKCYLAFTWSYPEEIIDHPQKKDWRFLRIKKNMPSANIFLGKSRMRAIREADYVFSIKHHDPDSNFFNHPYYPKDRTIEKWIYTDYRVKA